MQVLLFRSRWGLRTRAVGEHPKAAETVGIDVIRLRYRNVLLGGCSPGWPARTSDGGDQLLPGGMTAGRGFIGLAAMIVGRWTPIGAFGAALLFSSSQAVGQVDQFAPPTGDLGDVLLAVPRPVLRRAAVPRDDHRAGRASSGAASRPPPTASPTSARRRPERADIRRAERDRAAHPRPPGGPRAGTGARRRGHRGASCARPPHRGGRAPRPTRPAVHSVMRYLLHRLRLRAGQPQRARGPRACRPSRPLAEAVAATGPFDIVDVFRRSELCVAARAARPSRPAPRCLWLQLGVVNWEAARIAHDGGLGVVMDRCTAIECAAGAGAETRLGRRAGARRPPVSGRGSPRKTSTTPGDRRWPRRAGPGAGGRHRHRRAGLAVVADAAPPGVVARDVGVLRLERLVARPRPPRPRVAEGDQDRPRRPTARC